MAVSVWSVPANLAEPVVEEYGYAVDVLQASDGSEQRFLLRAHPVGAIDFYFSGSDAAECSLIEGLFYGGQPDLWIVPLWMHGRLLTGGDLSPGATSVPCDTVSAPFQDPSGLGPVAILWKNPGTYEVVNLTGVSPTALTVSPGTVLSWPALTTRVFPCRYARMESLARYTRETAARISGRVRLAFENHEAVGAAGAPAPSQNYVIWGGVVIPTS